MWIRLLVIIKSLLMRLLVVDPRSEAAPVLVGGLEYFSGNNKRRISIRPNASFAIVIHCVLWLKHRLSLLQSAAAADWHHSGSLGFLWAFRTTRCCSEQAWQISLDLCLLFLFFYKPSGIICLLAKPPRIRNHLWFFQILFSLSPKTVVHAYGLVNTETP